MGTGLGVRRENTMVVDRTLAGVVSGEHKRYVTAKIGELPALVGEAAANVLLGSKESFP